ncbi:UNVERIFIED_CONTAM: hypothetical protein K2H54_020993 [Gekko kuhli]
MTPNSPFSPDPDRDLGEHGHLFDGCVTISKDNMDKPIPYKYYISHGKEGDYEFIYKACQEGMVVNRCMLIHSDALSGTDWHQYDDIVCVKPSAGLWNRIKDHIPGMKKDIVKGKEVAAKVMLEGLFSILHTWTPTNVKNFLQQLHQFYLLNRRQMIFEERVLKEWTDLKFGETQVKELILDNLRETALYKRNTCTDSSSHDTVVQNKLGLALIILLLGGRYSLPTSENDLKQLCRLLCLEKPGADVVNEIHSVKDVFSELSRIEYCFIAFYNKCIEDQIHQWLWTIPVRHLFSASVDFAHVHVNSLLESEERWAGLEGLMFVEYRDKQQRSSSKEKSFLKCEKRVTMNLFDRFGFGRGREVAQ